MAPRRRLLKNFAALVAGVLPSRAAGKTIEIWFQDEARVGQQGTLSYQWALRGSRPPTVRDNRHDSAYLFGAICPARAVGAAIVTPWVNSEAMSVHLAEVGKQVCRGSHAVLVCDGAGWHQTGQRLTVPKNVTLLRLPPYSPELNPIENVWEYLRGNKLSRRVWQTYDDVVQACCDAWNWLIADTVRVSSPVHRQNGRIFGFALIRAADLTRLAARHIDQVFDRANDKGHSQPDVGQGKSTLLPFTPRAKQSLALKLNRHFAEHALAGEPRRDSDTQ